MTVPAPGRPKQDVDHPLLRKERSGDRVLTAVQADVALQVCEQIALGGTLAEVCKPGGKLQAPALVTFIRWMIMHPWIKQAYDAAVEIRAHSLEDEALSLARTASKAKRDLVPGIRTHLEQLRWSAEKGNPKQFGQRGVQSVTVPIQINTSMNLGQPGAEEAMSPDNIWKVEAKVLTPVDEVPHPDLTDKVGSPGPRKRVLVPKVLDDGSPNPDFVEQKRINMSAGQIAARLRKEAEDGEKE